MMTYDHIKSNLLVYNSVGKRHIRTFRAMSRPFEILRIKWLNWHGLILIYGYDFVLYIGECTIKEAIDQVSAAVKEKLLYWNNIKSRKIKVLLIVVFLGLIGVKIFTTVATFDWLAGVLG